MDTSGLKSPALLDLTRLQRRAEQTLDRISSAEIPLYDEGTWTPTYVTTGTGFSSVTYINTGGFYTRIGRLVQVQGTIRTSAITSGGASGSVRIGNLPFTANATANSGRASGSIGYSENFLGNRPNQAAVENNTNQIRLHYQHSNVNSAELAVADMLTTGNSNYIFFSATYTI